VCFFKNRQDNIKFPVCFSETVKVILFTLTVYAITVKNAKPSGNFKFLVVSAPKGVWVEKSWFSERCLKLWVSVPLLGGLAVETLSLLFLLQSLFLVAILGGVWRSLFWWWFVVAFVSVGFFLLYLPLSLSIYARHALVVVFSKKESTYLGRLSLEHSKITQKKFMSC
jgi:hypothetical protein